MWRSGSIVVFILLLGGLSSAAELPSHLLPSERNTISVFQSASPVVVNVSSSKLQRNFFSYNVMEVPAGTGTGFLWDRSGHIVSNFHVIGDADKVLITFKNGRTAAAQLIGGEPRKDIAVLKVKLPPDLPVNPLSVANSGELMVGQKAIAIGNPFGLDQSLSEGVISAVGRAIPGYGGVTIRDMIQTDAPINPGNSGGPLLDSRGFLIGMNTLIFSESGSSAGVGFAVPANTINRIVTEIIQHGRVKQPGLGIMALDDGAAARMGVEGVILLEVQRGGPAEAAGMRGTSRDRYGDIIIGDRIVAINGREIRNYDELYLALDEYKVGDQVKVTFVRGRRKQDVQVKLLDMQDVR